MSRFPVTRNRFKTKTVIFKVCFIGLFVAMTPFAYAGNVYISQHGGSASCGTDGTQVTQSASWFNSNAKGGNTYKLCGTFTGSGGSTMLTVPASGSSGSPLTIQFEKGAKLTAPYWSSHGAIYISNKNYVTIDGSYNGSACGFVNGTRVACNGSIVATANGTNLANRQMNTAGIVANGSHLEIRNLKVSGIYVKTGTEGAADEPIYDVSFAGTNMTGDSIHNCDLSDAQQNINVGAYGSTFTDFSIYNCYCHTSAWHISLSGQTTSTTLGSAGSPILIHNNEITDWMGWQNPEHTDGIFVWGVQNSTGPNAFVDIYNNYLHGDWTGTNGASPTGLVYCTYGLSASSGNYSSKCNIFNNVFFNETPGTGSDSGGSSVIINAGSSGNQIYNNTFVGLAANKSGSSAICLYSGGSGNNIIKNNIVYNLGQFIYDISNPSALTTDYNDIYSVNSMYASYGSLAAAQAAGHDTHSNSKSPNIGGSYPYAIQSASGGAYRTGANLTSLGIAELDSDAAGISRPSSGSWDIGAYEYSSALTPPTNVHLISSS